MSQLYVFALVGACARTYVRVYVCEFDGVLGACRSKRINYSHMTHISANCMIQLNVNVSLSCVNGLTIFDHAVRQNIPTA